MMMKLIDRMGLGCAALGMMMMAFGLLVDGRLMIALGIPWAGIGAVMIIDASWHR